MKQFTLLGLLAGLIIGLSIGFMLSPFIVVEEHLTLATWLEVVQRVCTSIGGLGTVFALFFVVRQFNLLRAQSELVQRNTRASMDSQLYARLDSFNRFIVDHEREYQLLNEPFARAQEVEHKSGVHRLCELGFTFYEEIYKHHVRYTLLETEDWDEWQQNMAHFFNKPYARGYWPTIAARFARSFQTFVNDLLAKTQSKPPA